MTDFQSKMQEVAKQNELAMASQQETSERAQKHSSMTKEHVKTVLDSLSAEFAEGDHRLSLEPSNSPTSPGFSISYGNLYPPFSVTTVCHPDSVEVHVSDGHWEQLSNVLGNWNDWTDDKVVYTGCPHESKIRESLESSFLEWYNRATKAPDAPSNPN